ncbi:hypothetical protein Mlute_01594 [Meiothermus luteus]|jgi:hypothetical protein|uniref:Uncharacterized protein n=1 Tax=Meiothermus luteus TaxID=2026184 RepID=A0A399EMZ3_9DEIN|nr:hypothetical protein [Meiothermus luteus]RIH85348.1 hypothetical protein Mlute_01594 [Meiothermus luteus]RMH53308.1 MAG: hypothetical protein D6684_12795 [Deinococcota bacterium]
MKKLWVVIGTGLCALALAQAVQKTYRLIINGQAASGQAVVVGGKTYVSLDALKAAGVGVSLSGSTLSLTLPGPPQAQGGANQVAALEGCLNEWLFNGIWRFRVLSVEPLPAGGREGWKAKVELRNGTNVNGAALAGTGWQGLLLVLDNGNTIESGYVQMRDKPFAQGTGMVQEAVFYSKETDRTPTKLLLLLNPKRMLTTLPVRYTVPDPSFRVRLDCRG